MIHSTVTGMLLRDPQFKISATSGKPVTSFLLSAFVANNETTLITGIAFDETAEKIAKLRKGEALTIAGSLKPTTWHDKTSGQLRHGLNITVSVALSVYDAKNAVTATNPNLTANAAQIAPQFA